VGSGSTTGKVTVTNSGETATSLSDFAMVEPVDTTEFLTFDDLQMYSPKQAIAQQGSTDLTALTELVNQKIDANDLQMLLPDINTQIRQEIAALPTSTSTIDLTDIWTYGGNY